MSEILDKWVDLTSQLSPEEKSKAFKYIFQSNTQSTDMPTPYELINGLSNQAKAEFATQSLNQLDEAAKTAIVQSVFSAPSPGKANNTIWLIFVCALSLIFVIAAISLIYGMFVSMEGKIYFVKPETIFTVWSTVTAYLVGLFSPLPSSDQKK